MYDIVFLHNSSWPETALETAKDKFPLAKVVYDSDPFSVAVNYTGTVRTKMFWIIPTVQVLSFEFLKIDPVFLDRISYLEDVNNNRIYLIPAKKPVTEKDFESAKFLVGTRYKKSSVSYDVFFLSYNESYAEDNWKQLKSKVPSANRINGIQGIANAHRKAALGTATGFLWVVDADAIIDDSFKFTYQVSADHFDTVHIWKSKNPVNGLEYGYGGIKLLPKHLLIEKAVGVDVTTSLSHNIKIMNEISNVTNFAVSPFEAWKGAFRECAKLASQIIDRQDTSETQQRLAQWLQPSNHEFTSYIFDGAQQGQLFGKECRSDLSALSLINDYTWLQNQFETRSLAIGKISAIT
jgi:hypothetical protein